MNAPSPAASTRERGRPFAVALALSVLALGYTVAVIVVAWRAPDKGFVSFTGRRVIAVEPQSEAAQAGVRRGDVVEAIDGRPITSTLEYAYDLLRRRPGETVILDFLRPPSAARLRATITMRPSPPPLPAITASILAVALLALGLIARYGRPGDLAARRFWRNTLVYGVVFAGALSWNLLVVHPLLAAVFGVALFAAPSVAADFGVSFPSLLDAATIRRWRILIYLPATLLFLATCGSLGWAAWRFRAGDPHTDEILRWTVRFVGWQLAFATVPVIGGLIAQYRTADGLDGSERGQLRWLLFGLTVSVLPALAAIPVAIADRDLFLLVRYRPFVVVTAVLAFAATSLAVLRVRLADVDVVIRRSVVYALASGGAVGVYAAVVLVVGIVAERLLGRAQLLAHGLAAIAAAALFGPLRRHVTRWLDRRFFRDRLHYVQALRELGDAVTRVQEPGALAREVTAGVKTALRATAAALYLAGEQDALGLAHAEGDFPATPPPEAPAGGLAVPISRSERTLGMLVVGARRDGDLYTGQDRDLLGALAGQLAIAVENARAFGTIATLGRSLEQQNREIRGLRDRLEDENRYLRGRIDQSVGSDTQIIGDSKAARELRRQIALVAPTHAQVLLLGESGTGKGLVARALHAASDRAQKPFIQVDCGALPQGIFESELFGHERGAFTGAVRMRRGHFELADGGTLFLDEIGELPLPLQPKLLRVLQERSFERVGGTGPVQVDVRVLAATNRDLDAMVARGHFREDLYFRLRVVELLVPPLRARKGDVPALCEHVLPRLCRRNNRPLCRVSAEALARLQAYGWPGNVRELENVLERAVVLSGRRELEPDDLTLPDRPPSRAELEQDAAAGPSEDGETDHQEVMEAIERRRLVAALRAAGGNQTNAARSLGIARTTLINKLRRYGLL